MGIIVAGVLIAAAIAAWVVVHHGRTGPKRASPAVQARVATAVEQWFGPASARRHFPLREVLYPICVSHADGRFAFAVVNPIQPDGTVAQPGWFYLRRVAGNYHVLGTLLTAGTSLDRPHGVPLDVYRDFGVGGPPRACAFQGPSAVAKTLREHSAPTFRG
jgi:hypothetical protein